MIQPQDTFKSECTAEFFFNLLLTEVLITVYRTQTFCRCQHGTAAVTVNAAAFKDIWTHVHTHHILFECPLIEYVPGYLIIQVRGELESPTVEHEIIKVFLSAVTEYTDAAMVTCPCVIEG